MEELHHLENSRNRIMAQGEITLRYQWQSLEELTSRFFHQRPGRIKNQPLQLRKSEHLLLH